MSTPQFFYPYTVRRSPRARHVRLIVSSEGLVVVVPQKFSASQDLLLLLEGKKAWIEKSLEKVRLRASLKEETKGLPETVELRAAGELWRVEFASLSQERLVVRDGTVTLTSDFNESEALSALKRWVLSKGRAHLPLMLSEIANRYRFSYVGVAVKEQKSLWGSCSSKGNVNLNSRLMFLPPDLVRHVMLHELCHLREMNHSKAFHDMLARLDPESGRRAGELKRAWSFVPGWAL